MVQLAATPCGIHHELPKHVELDRWETGCPANRFTATLHHCDVPFLDMINHDPVIDICQTFGAIMSPLRFLECAPLRPRA